jgi:catechol 2,3-dioxygenase-like lactoylglutathione lyase family enzyme
VIHHIDFAVTDFARSRAFYVATMAAAYAAGLRAGGTNNGGPGLRPRYAEHYYAAFILDPDGHNIEAVCRQPA